MALSNTPLYRNIFIGVIVTLVLVVLGEVIWAARTLSDKTPTATPSPTRAATSTPAPVSKIAALMVRSDKKELMVGEVATFTVTISSTDLVDGADAIISFDPKLFTLDKTSTTSAKVKMGTIFSIYPDNKIDDKTGRVVVSGINESLSGQKVNGVFGTFTLKAKAKGTAKLDFVFSPGDTSDSNVVETKTGNDILQRVQGAEVVIK